MTSPRLLRTVLGTMCAGYMGVPGIKPACDNRMCRGVNPGLIKVNYIFPKWFLTRALYLAVYFAPNSGPEFHLRCLRMRPRDAAIFSAAYYGDTETVKKILRAGEGSVLDVTDYSGHTPLHEAVTHGKTDVARLFLQAGADPFIENSHNE